MQKLLLGLKIARNRFLGQSPPSGVIELEKSSERGRRPFSVKEMIGLTLKVEKIYSASQKSTSKARNCPLNSGR